MEIIRISRNVHVIDFPNTEKKTTSIAFLSDIHWDNPKCDRVKLKKHLDYCKEHGIPVFINGDFFCLMQGKYDPRRSKKDILPEHNKSNYIDVVIEDAVNWWKPYADIWTVIAYGNHETAIVKNLETDPLQRFVDTLNYECKSNVQTGGYGGWLILKTKPNNCTTLSHKVRYFHGSGGGGMVTRGEINLTRALEMYENMDIFTMGHVHENKATNVVRNSVAYNPGKHVYEIQNRDIHLMITGTYKEEYEDGAFGWHVERGAPVKPTGGRIVDIHTNVINIKKTRNFEVIIDSRQFPI